MNPCSRALAAVLLTPISLALGAPEPAPTRGDTLPTPARPHTPIASDPRGAGPVCPGCELELFVVVDQAFQDEHGLLNISSVIQEVVDLTDDIFSENQSAGGLDLRVRFVDGAFFSSVDPWAPSTDAIQLLGNFQDWTSNTLPTPVPGRNVVVLMTGETLSGGNLLGASFQDGFCSFFSVCVVSVIGTDHNAHAEKLAHHIGHILGAVHDEDDNDCTGFFVMNLHAGPGNTDAFSPCSVEEVNSFLAGVSCIQPPPCNAADLAPPFASLDFSDVVAFLTAFAAMDAQADLAPPLGSFDFSDVVAFLGAFGAGCP